MGNRAVITTAENLEKDGVELQNRTDKIGIYLHWNGGLDSIQAFLTYAKMQGIRSPIDDNYGWARLCQIIANYFTEKPQDVLSIGIDMLNNVDCDNIDNGVYCIDTNWDIVKRFYNDGPERTNHDLTEMLNDIDIHQPTCMQLGNQVISDWLANNEPSKLNITTERKQND